MNLINFYSRKQRGSDDELRPHQADGQQWVCLFSSLVYIRIRSMCLYIYTPPYFFDLFG